ncbi:hypothetical protein [Streptomyces sp. NPDC057052]|uniref:hypothetical protein n=1 Tax=Streptomyces sp. NPDC057052 TaxID=3346010 RepID=UPI00362724DA
MSEEPGRAWTAMTPGDFDREAPLRLNVRTGGAAVPAEPDECGTAPLFGDEAPARRPPARPRRRDATTHEQERLF